MNSSNNEDRNIEEQLKNIDIENIEFSHAYLPYSHWRVKEVFSDMGYELHPYYCWYKATRYISAQSYVIVNSEDNTILGRETGYTLYELCCVLAQNQVPLHSKPIHETYNKDGRRKSCVEFLDIVSRFENSADCEVEK